MSKDNMNNDHDDHELNDGNEEDNENNIIHTLKDKAGFGYIAFGLLILVIVFLGARNKIMEYFVSKPAATKTQAVMPTQPSIPKTSTVISSSEAPVVTNTSVLSEDKIKETVKDFIINNPEVIVESLTKFQQKLTEQRAQESKEYINKSADKILADKPFIGNKNGTLVITEFFDYKCGYCKKVYSDLLRLLKEYPNLKIVLVELPYAGPTSTQAVKFSLAVNALYPEKFNDFHSSLMNAASIDDTMIYGLISQYNMDKSKLVEKANSDDIEKAISQNIQQAAKAGVQGVPSFLINGEFIQGAVGYDEFKKKLDGFINKG